MNSEEFIDKCKDMVVEFYNTVVDYGDYSLDTGSINVVFLSCVGSDYKTVLTTFEDNLFYEVTYYRRDDAFVFDVYHKCSHQVYKV